MSQPIKSARPWYCVVSFSHSLSFHLFTGIFAENIAFLIRHNQSSYGKSIDPNDVSMCSRNWQGMKKGNGPAGIGVFVNGNGYTHTVCRVQVLKGQSAVEQFAASVDGFMATFFPNPLA
jgi:hypothetical protein